MSIHDKDKNEYINRMINIFFNLISALCICIIAVMPFLFPVLVNQGYKDAYYQIPVLMIAVFFQALQGLYSSIYVALKKTKEIAKTSIFSAIINIVVNLVLIQFIGLFAASVSTLVAFMSMAIYRYVDIKKYVPLKILGKNILIALAIGLIACGAYYTENKIICGVCLIVVLAYTFLINKGFLIRTAAVLKGKIRKLIRR